MSSSAATLPSKLWPMIRRLPGSHPGRPMIIITFAGVGIVWMFRMGLALAILKADFFSRRALMWLLPPVLLVTSAAASLTGAATVGRFYVSRPAMDWYARSFLAGEADRHPLLDEYGFAYSPHGRPERIGEDNYVHLSGPWYVWEQSW